MLFIVEKCSKSGDALLSIVIVSKHQLETVFNQIITVIVNTVSKIVYISARANFFVEVFEHSINQRIDAGRVFSNHFLGVKIWNAFAAHVSSKHILMSVYKCVNAGFS